MSLFKESPICTHFEQPDHARPSPVLFFQDSPLEISRAEHQGRHPQPVADQGCQVNLVAAVVGEARRVLAVGLDEVGPGKAAGAQVAAGEGGLEGGGLQRRQIDVNFEF